MDEENNTLQMELSTLIEEKEELELSLTDALKTKKDSGETSVSFSFLDLLLMNLLSLMFIRAVGARNFVRDSFPKWALIMARI